ncbi:MAG TPA: transglutaminase-like domain-containing protein [Mucilaginibacter sp.]|jgi:hypothetical protein|nr:transglutaminase-like domain-containing protein [Mucilaginibacter sp.]
MIKFLVSYFICLIVVLNAIAVPTDSSASIISSKNSYEFIYNQKAGRVEVKEILNTLYTSNTYAVKLPVAEVYNNDVTIDNVEANVDNHSVHDFKPIYSYYSTDDVFFSDEKICYFPLMLPKRGSTANVTFSETIDDPRYFTTVYFSNEWAIKHGEVSVKIPRWMNVELKEMNFKDYAIDKTTTYDNKSDADIITYTIQNLPAMQREDNSPGPTYIYPHLLVLCKSATVGGRNLKYFGTLADQYGWYHILAGEINTNKEIIKAKATELTAGLNSEMDKVKAIFYYVMDNVRYIAFEDGMAGFKPEKADEVLRKKYGDCKGMANLTKELLTSLGFDARLCWLGTDHIAYDYQTPSLAVDNHMICGLIYKGKTIYLDATEKYLGINEYAERIQNRQVLMEDGERYILTRVPNAGPSQNYDFETSQLSINGSGLAGNVTHLWKGEDKERVLSGLNNIKKEKADEAMVRFLSNGNNDHHINNLKLTKTDDVDKDLTASYSFDDKKAISVFGKSYYIELDPQKEFNNLNLKIPGRKHDYWFDYKMNICKEIELLLPANYKATSLPVALNIVDSDYEFHIQYTLLSGKLIYKKSLRIKNTHLPTSKFAKWNNDIEQLSKAYDQNITLEPITQ